jgi:alkylation response protein AidB-like acyl-CoA dehydrogenase
VAEFGSDEQQREWLAPLVAGETVLTAALFDESWSEAGLPGTRARRRNARWSISGRKRLVPAAHLAARCLVPASVEGGMGIFLVDPEAPGVRLERARTSTGEPLFAMDLEEVALGDEALLGGTTTDAGESGRRLNWLRERAVVATCAMQVGVCERALRLTASYTGERKQFGVPIGSFQAVQHRMADGFIDLAAMRWTMWRAAWKLASGQTAARDAAVAKFWASEAAARIATSAQHLHGGMGVDVDYPVHRYLLWAKSLELSFGAAGEHLAWLGRDLASGAIQESA